ncbi:MAG: peptidylprolyl isomerase [Candidatus Micrarchaeota archaeon]|nr:peptidylprolyl isomerase [Candidatus Micrarchaeota archaeon]
MKPILLALLAFSLLAFGCTQAPVQAQPGLASTIQATAAPANGGNNMAVKNGDIVSVDYLGTSEGKVFDTSIKAEAEKAGLPLRSSYEPLSFTVGAGQMIAGFDKAVAGMKVGEEKTVTLAPEQAYGESSNEMIITVNKSQFGDGETPSVGLQVFSPGGQPGTITKVDGENVTIDFNHELAGKTLTFKIIMRKIQSA